MKEFVDEETIKNIFEDNDKQFLKIMEGYEPDVIQMDEYGRSDELLQNKTL